MAGCNCKGKVSMEAMGDSTQSEQKSFFEKFIKYSLKTLMFLMFLMALPFINLYIIYLSFNIIILNESVDIKPLLLAIGNKFKPKDDDDDDLIDDEEFQKLTEDDVVLLDAEDITDKQM